MKDLDLTEIDSLFPYLLRNFQPDSSRLAEVESLFSLPAQILHYLNMFLATDVKNYC